MSRRPLHFFWLVDCSGSMAGDKIGAVNKAGRELTPVLRGTAEVNPEAEILVRVLKFSARADWIVEKPTPIGSFEWVDLDAGGETAMGAALALVSGALKIGEPPRFPKRALPPVLLLITDGQPTDDFDEGLKRLMGSDWGPKSIRIGIAIGSDADKALLARFTSVGPDTKAPLVYEAHNAHELATQIRFASTDAVQRASQPKVEGGALTPTPSAAPPVSIPSPAPGPSGGGTEDVW